jgi:DNA-binding SARP family transcriptional activator
MLSNSDWTYSKSKELFYYLFLNPPATKAQIGLALWPEASPDQLRNIFHRTLHYLRKALGGPQWITFAVGDYAPAPGINSWCDVREFESRLVVVRTSPISNLLQPAERERARQLLTEAVELWRGDFLADMDVGVWGLTLGEVLRRSHMQALMDLGQLNVAEARYADAIRFYQRVLAADNYFEAAHRELMRCFARLGEASHALQHYKSLRKLLHAELAAEPSPETTLLYERVRRGDDV